jgi:hypothetical protein
MKLPQIASVLLAVVLVATAGAAAMPGNAPVDAQTGQADENYNDSADEGAIDANASDAQDAQNDSEAQNNSDASAPDDRRGPPTDMPEQAPDFVTEIHELINQKLDGTLEDLGEALSAVTPDEDADDAGSEQADGDDEESADDADSDDEAESNEESENEDEQDTDDEQDGDDAEA